MSSEADAAAAWAEVQANPRNHAAWNFLAVSAVRAGRADLAIGYAERAHSLDRRNGDYLGTLGVALVEAGRIDEGIGMLQRAVKLQPASAEARCNLGNALGKARRLEEALESFRRAATLDPRRADLKSRVGAALWRLGRSEEALPLLRQVYEKTPDEPEAIVDFANALLDAEGSEAAVRFLRRELVRVPGQPWLRFRLAQALLSLGLWEEGWREYLWRPSAMRDVQSPLPERLPAAMSGARVLLLPDQGLGDMFFFLRFAGELARRGAQARFCAPGKLAPLLKAQELAFGLAADSRDDGAARISLSDLPYLLGASAAAPSIVLRPRPELLERWHRELARVGRGPFVGVTWRAGTDPGANPEFGGPADLLFKEIEPRLLGSALAGEQGTLVILQRNPHPADIALLAQAARRPVHDLSALNENLEEMAALLALLDDYVGVSNTNTHIRAAVGRGGKVLVPYPPEFRWMADGAQSPWFPGFRIYRQTRQRDWTAALAALREDFAAARV